MRDTQQRVNRELSPSIGEEANLGTNVHGARCGSVIVVLYCVVALVPFLKERVGNRKMNLYQAERSNWFYMHL